MTDSNTTPADPFSLSAEQAGNELAKMPLWLRRLHP